MSKSTKLLVFIRFSATRRKIKTLVLSLVLYSIMVPVPPIYYLHAGIFTFLFLTYTFVINDYSDIEIDKLAGKDRPIHHLPLLQTKLIITLLLVLAAGYYLVFFSSAGTWWLIGSIYLSTFYSLEPFRFKTKGFVGVVVSSLCQEMIIFLTIINGLPIKQELMLTIFFTVTLFIRGIHGGMVHQLIDKPYDQMSGISTWATKTSQGAVRGLGRLSLWLTAVTTLLFLPLVYYKTNLEQAIIITILWALVMQNLLYFGENNRFLWFKNA